MMTLLVATKNQKKLKELRAIFALALPEGVHVQSLDDLDSSVPDVVEDRQTFHGNAIKKAIEMSHHTARTVLSEDSGLVVDALGGAPGVHSARYSGVTQGRDAANNTKLIAELTALGAWSAGPVAARYVAVACLALKDDAMGAWFVSQFEAAGVERCEGEPETAGVLGQCGDRHVIWWRGECEGEIQAEHRGDGGFGYDPHFYVAELDRTLAQVTLEQKSQRSHRRHAIARMCALLSP